MARDRDMAGTLAEDTGANTAAGAATGALAGGLLGGVAGAALAGLVIALILGGAGTATMLSGRPPIGWGDALWLLLLPIAIALLATQVARGALLKALHERL